MPEDITPEEQPQQELDEYQFVDRKSNDDDNYDQYMRSPISTGASRRYRLNALANLRQRWNTAYAINIGIGTILIIHPWLHCSLVLFVVTAASFRVVSQLLRPQLNSKDHGKNSVPKRNRFFLHQWAEDHLHLLLAITLFHELYAKRRLAQVWQDFTASLHDAQVSLDQLAEQSKQLADLIAKNCDSEAVREFAHSVEGPKQ